MAPPVFQIRLTVTMAPPVFQMSLYSDHGSIGFSDETVQAYLKHRFFLDEIVQSHLKNRLSHGHCTNTAEKPVEPWSLYSLI